MAIIKTAKKKSNPTVKLEVNGRKQYVNYKEKLLSALYTLSRRRRSKKIHKNSIVNYMKHFSNERPSTHSTPRINFINSAKKSLELDGLIEVDKGNYCSLTPLVKDGIKVGRKEKDDSDDDEIATISYFKSIFKPHQQARKNSSSTRKNNNKSISTKKQLKSTGNNKRKASKNLSSDDSSSDENIIIQKPKVLVKASSRKKKVKKVDVEQVQDEEAVGEESDLTELESSEDEYKEVKRKKVVKNVGLQKLTKAELIKKLEDFQTNKNVQDAEKDDAEENEDISVEHQEEVDEEAIVKAQELKILAVGFTKLEKANQILKARLERYENIVEDEDGNVVVEENVLNRQIELEENQDLGGMDEFMPFDDSGYQDLQDAASVADTEFSNSENVVSNRLLIRVDPNIEDNSRKVLAEAELELGFNHSYPQLNLGEDRSSSPGPSITKVQLPTRMLESIQPTSSFRSNHIPSPANSFIGAEDSLRSDNDDEVLSAENKLYNNKGKQVEVNAFQTPDLSSSPFKPNTSTSNFNSTSHSVGISNQPRSSSMERSPRIFDLNYQVETEKIKESLRVVEEAREKEKEKYLELSSGLQLEIEVVTKQYQDLVESSEAELEALRFTITDFDEKLINAQAVSKDVETRRSIVETDLRQAKDRINVLEDQLANQTQYMEESNLIAQTQIIQLEKALEELTESFDSLKESTNLEITQSKSRQADLETEFTTTISSMSLKPTVNASIGTGEDPAFEELRLSLSKEKEEVVRRLESELETSEKERSSLASQNIALQGDIASLEESHSKETENWRQEKLDLEETVFTSNQDLAMELDKSTNLAAEVTSLNDVKLRLEGTATISIQKLIVEEEKTTKLNEEMIRVQSELQELLIQSTQKLAIEEGKSVELREKVVELTKEKEEIKVEQTRVLEAHATELESTAAAFKKTNEEMKLMIQEIERTAALSKLENQNKINLLINEIESGLKSLSELASSYGIETNEPLAQIEQLSTRLHDIDNLSHQLVESIMNLVPVSSAIDQEQEESMFKDDEEVNSDLIIDLKKLKSRLATYLQSRNSLIQRFVSKSGELEQLIDPSRKGINSESTIEEVIELAKGKFSEVKNQVVEVKKRLEVKEKEQMLVAVEVAQKCRDLTRVEDEFEKYRRNSLSAFKEQGRAMGWIEVGDQVEMEDDRELITMTQP